MTDAIDIDTDDRKLVLSLLEQYLPNVVVWAYGSRVKWTARPQSDLDLVAFASGEQREAVFNLREALEESSLPFPVDLFIWDELPESFRKRIEAEHVVLQARNETIMGNRWRKVALGDVTDLILSSVDKKTRDNECAVQLCNYTDVYYNSFINANLYFMRATATEREIAKCSLFSGDVVITKDSEKHDDIGVPALVREDIPGLVCGYHLAILRPIPSEIEGNYLFYVLCTNEVQHQFHSYANGITRFGLRKADIGLVEIPLPPLPEQRAIAHILGTLDDKIELNRRMNETLEAMARALFKAWFVDFDPVRAKIAGKSPDFGLICDRMTEKGPELPKRIAALFPDRLVESELGEIPEGWEVVPLPEMIEVNPPRSLRKGEVAPYLDMANMPTRGHVPDAVIDRPFGSGMRFTNGDTLVARITPCLENGKTAYVDFLPHNRIGWGSTEYIVMRPMSPLPNEFAYCLARSAGFREFAIQNMTGTSGRQRVPAKALSQFLFPSPPEPIAARFGEIVQPLFARAGEAVRESRALAALRDTLLPKLLSGEIEFPAAEAISESQRRYHNVIGHPD